MRFHSLLPLLAGLAALSSCGGPTDPAFEAINAHAKWLAKAPSSYSYTVARWCECLDEWIGPVEIVVRNRVVESRTYVRTGVPVAPTKYWDRFAVVDTLFARIFQAQSGKPDRISVSYDPEYGFPTRVFVDQFDQYADDEYTLAASNFRVR